MNDKVLIEISQIDQNLKEQSSQHDTHDEIRTWRLTWKYCRVCIVFASGIIENGFKLTKERSRRYPAKTITDADYADDIAFLAKATAQT